MEEQPNTTLAGQAIPVIIWQISPLLTMFVTVQELAKRLPFNAQPQLKARQPELQEQLARPKWVALGQPPEPWAMLPQAAIPIMIARLVVAE